MTVTTLERAELLRDGRGSAAALIVEDFSIPCDFPGCDHAATYAVRTFCCPKLRCEHCLGQMLMLIADHIGRNAFCVWHPEIIVRVNDVSDVIKSVDPL